MKRVYICKVFNEKDVESKISKLVAKCKKRFGNNIKVFCTDDKLQKRLQTMGIPSELFYSFFDNYAADEPIWETVFKMSDELHASAENDESLKYRNTNFLTLEYDILKYISLLQLSGLCQRMTKQKFDALILILTSPYNLQLRDINTAKIKTVKYQENLAAVKTLYQAIYRFSRLFVYQCFSLIRWLFTLAFNPNKKLPNKIHIVAKSTSKQQPRVLFVVTGQLHVPSTLAICESSVKNGMTPYIATEDGSLIPSLQTQPFSYLYRNSMFSIMSYMIKILSLNSKLRRHIKALDRNINRRYKETDEFSPGYLCRTTLLHDLRFLCFEAVYNINFMERIISIVSPDVVCVMPDMYFLQQLAVVLAKRNDIPTMTCSAAWDFDHPRPLLRRFHVDKIATMGEKVKKAYVNSGIKPDRIVIVGVAHFDRMFNRNKDKDAQALLDNGIDPSNNIIVFATQPPFNETEEMLMGVIETILKMQDVHLIVKIHPREEIRAYQVIADKFHDSRIHVVKDIDLYALISNCQLFITQFSTTALEAMMLDKLVITINLSGKPVTVPYAEEGASLGVYKYKDIEPAILKALNDKETRDKLKARRYKFVREWAGEPDGKASQRIVDLIKKMIQDSKKRHASKR